LPVSGAGAAARIRRHAKPAFDQRLEADQLIGMGEDHRGPADGEQAGIELAHVERRDLRGCDRAALAQILPECQPLTDVGRIEAEPAVLGIERLAALAQPDLERRLVASAVEQPEKAGRFTALEISSASAPTCAQVMSKVGGARPSEAINVWSNIIAVEFKPRLTP